MWVRTNPQSTTFPQSTWPRTAVSRSHVILCKVTRGALNGVAKVGISFDDLFPLISQLVVTSELDGVDDNDDSREDVACHARIDAGSVPWRILPSKDQGSCNTANTTKADKRR